MEDAIASKTPSAAAGSRRTRWRAQAGRVKRATGRLIRTLAHPGTPWYAKMLLFLVAVYLASPIDLIPDFIPVLGWLDDIALMLLAGWLIARLVPAHVMAAVGEGEISWKWRAFGALFVVLLWVGLAVAMFWIIS